MKNIVIIVLIVIIIIEPLFIKRFFNKEVTEHTNNDKYIHRLAYLECQIPHGYPLIGYISSGFGLRVSPFDSTKFEFHKGIDIVPSTLDDTIRATHNGIATIYYSDDGYGKVVILESNFYETKYAHLSKILVKNGEVVRRLQPIGICGDTGKTTGIHLHYEIIANGRNLNPSNFLDAFRKDFLVY